MLRFATVLLSIAISLSATIINVPTDQNSIQVGINTSVDGDTVLVQPGTYVENINFNGKNIVLGSLFLTTQDTSYITTTIIDGNQSGSVVTFWTNETRDAILMGFTITNGNTWNGAGIRCASSPTLSDLIIHNNDGGGGNGGGIFIDGYPVLKNLRITNNINCWFGGGINVTSGGDADILNCLIANNSAEVHGAGIYSISDNEITVINSTIADNQGVGIYFHDYVDSIKVINSILAGNQTDIRIPESATADIRHCLFEQVIGGVGNINADPRFIDSQNMNFRLSGYSLCIGAGLDMPIVPSHDIDGNARPNPAGSNPDMGAFENQFATPQHIPITINIPDDYPTIQAGLNAAESIDTVLVHPGTYYENIMWPHANGITLISSGESNNTIIDGNGLSSVIYMNTQTIDIDSTTLISGFTLTNGGNAYYGGGLTIIGGSPTVSYMKISNNSGNTGGGIYLFESSSTFIDIKIDSNNSTTSGGGVNSYLSNPVMQNVTIKDNSAIENGGGMYTHTSTPILSNVIISNNTAHDGGGMYMDFYSDVNPYKVNVINNSASHDGGGWHIRYSSGVTLTDLNIIDNSAGHNGGGVYVYGCHPQLQELNILNNYAANFGSGVNTNAGLPSISYSNIARNGSGVYSEDHYLDAINNYWGDISGPYHPAENQLGQGDSVNVRFSVIPWLTTPNNDAPPLPAHNVMVAGSGNDFVNIEWNQSPLGDFAGYKLYYDTDESGYPYYNSIDIGINTSHTLSELEPGTEYFIAVSVYDTDGNESWYSDEVIGITREMEVQNLDIAGDEALFHLITHDPLVTFDYFDSMGEAQSNYHLQISTDSAFQTNIIWDSGEVASDATSIQYTEGALLDGVKYFVRTKVASGMFWSEWNDLAFGMNTEPNMPIQISLIGDEVTTNDVLLQIANSSDAEEDNLTYDFRLYDATQAIQLDSANAVAHNPDGTEWEVTTALVDNSQHWWTVQAFDGYEYSELAGPESFLINFENDDPEGFDLTSPLLDESIINQSPLFTWNPAVDSDPLDTVSYVLYLDTPDPGGETFYPGIDTSFQLDYNLEDNTTYHWKVVAHDLNDSETESNGRYQSFTVNTANDLPEYFELLYPVWNEMVANLQPEFLWDVSSDPDDETIVMRSSGKGHLADQTGSDNTVDVITGYDFYLSADSLLADVVPVEVIGTSYSPETDLAENQVYYWAVSAVDDSGGVTFSDTASFWTNSVNSSPSELTLLTPVDDTESSITPTFSWTLSTDADFQDTLNYTLRYGTDVFSLMDVPKGSSTQFTVVEPLEDNTEYIWQVIAEDIQGATFATEFSSFFVNSENDDPGLFSLNAPDSAAWITNSDLMLVWEPSTDLEGAHVEYVIHMGPDNESLDPVDTIGVNYFALNELEDGYYYWQIEAMDNIGGTQFTETWSFLINVHNDPPDPFALTYPEADLVLTEQQPTFTWEASSSGDAGDHTSYRVELGNSAENMGVVYEGDSTFYTPESLLADNSVYYWRVVAIDLAFATTVNEGGYHSFVVNTVNDSPTIAELISPDSVVVLSDTPVFSWNASTDVDPYDSLSYELHWWTDVTEMDSILSTETSGSPETPLADDNLQYFWNVITMDANGGIAHSEEKTFWVDFMPEVPGLFALLGPDSASTGNGTRPELTWAEAIDPDPFDAVHYSVAVATDSLMENVIYEQVAHVEVTIPEMDLENDTRYYWQVTAIDEDSLLTESSIWTFDVGYVAIDQYAQVPTEFMLDQNYPNPFNPSTTIRYGLPEETNVSLVIYDVRGQVVQTLESERQSAGWYDVVWNGQTASGKTISTGIYFARLVAGEYSQVIKMLYLK